MIYLNKEERMREICEKFKNECDPSLFILKNSFINLGKSVTLDIEDIFKFLGITLSEPDDFQNTDCDSSCDECRWNVAWKSPVKEFVNRITEESNMEILYDIIYDYNDGEFEKCAKELFEFCYHVMMEGIDLTDVEELELLATLYDDSKALNKFIYVVVDIFTMLEGDQ